MADAIELVGGDADLDGFADRVEREPADAACLADIGDVGRRIHLESAVAH